MRSCCIAQGTTSSHLWWSMIMWEKEWIYVCVTGSPCCMVENWQNHVSQLWWGKKKEQNNAFTASWMEPETLLLSEVSQNDTNTIWYHLYLESNIWHKWNFPQKRNSGTWRRDLWLPKGWGVMNWESGVNRCKLLHVEGISNEILLYSTGNYI